MFGDHFENSFNCALAGNDQERVGGDSEWVRERQPDPTGAVIDAEDPGHVRAATAAL